LKKGGKGGALTQSGLRFEKETDLQRALLDLPGYRVLGDRVFKSGKPIGQLCGKYRLYSHFLAPRGVRWRDTLSKRLLPDEAVYLDETKSLYIIEKKFQETEGSVDEKLQTCDFKKKQYSRLVHQLGVKVEIVFVLNDWFRQPKYHDTLQYIEDTGCHYYFNEIPLEAIGL
jgi:hypothetical protein